MILWVGIGLAVVGFVLVGFAAYFFSAAQTVERENERLRIENADLLGRLGAVTESLVRIKRSAFGMSEMERRPRGMEPPPTVTIPGPPVPAELRRELDGIGDPRIRAMVASAAQRARARDGSWESVKQNYGPQPGDDGEPDFGDEGRGPE